MERDFFVCENCGKEVSFNALGTHNRNHCPFCLWSVHVDESIPGDRRSRCYGLMEPTGISFKDEGVDKYGKKRQGEMALIHKCEKCGKETKNRLSGDDNPQKVIELSEKSNLNEKEKEEVKVQLFGKTTGTAR